MIYRLDPIEIKDKLRPLPVDLDGVFFSLTLQTFLIVQVSNRVNIFRDESKKKKRVM